MRRHLVAATLWGLLGAGTASCVGAAPPAPDDEAEDTITCDPWLEPAYGECEQGVCSDAELCAVDANPPSFTVCARTGCRGPCDCPTPLEGTATPICSSFADASLPTACYLACEADAECPTGMVCVGEQLCMFPI